MRRIFTDRRARPDVHTLVQGVIFLSGAFAIFLTQDPREEYRQWACIVGLVGQPFWIYATTMARQGGMFALTLIYTAAWMRGIFVYWVL